jgi:ABC-type ATPase with predicted acetyltransferase domain
MKDILLDCGKSLNYICSCMCVCVTNKDSEKRDFFAKFLLDNGVDKTQIKDGMVYATKNSLPKWSEVTELYNEMHTNDNNKKFVRYNECPVLCTLKRKEEPLITKVKTDEFTAMAESCFDYKFTGESMVYPYELPKLPDDFGICCIVGASGSGKSTMLREFDSRYNFEDKKFDDNAIVSNFETPEIASERLSASGLNSMPVWCRPRRVLSVGEGFRADLALNMDSYKIFDEFTSTIDRNVAKSTCNGIQRYIRKNNIHNIVFCSCHKDYISFLKPDIVIDLDEEKVFDCRGKRLGETLPCKSTNQMPKTCGAFLGSIII